MAAESKADEHRLIELMIGYQNGNVEDFAGLYDALKRPLLRYLWTFVRNASVAEDLLQDTFLQVHRARHTYTPPRPVRPWIYAITRHVALMHLRSARRRKEVLPDDRLPDLPVPPDVEKLADRINDFVDTIEDRVTTFEDMVETSPPQEIRASVSAVRRQTAVVRRFISPQRDALDALYRDSKGMLTQQQAFMIREQADRIARDVEELDLVRERSLVITEELLNRIAQEQNSRMYVLSIIAAIFLPITFITGLFGMNVAGLPGVEHQAAFLIVAGLMLGVTLATLALLRAKRWF